MKKKPIDPEVSKAAAALGRKGGSNGTGAVKTRPADFYTVTLPAARARARALREATQKK